MFATWLYISTSVLGQNVGDEIAKIQSVAKSRNPKLGLTGALIFSGHHFAQYLEGPDDGLKIMKTSICKDDRHVHILTLQAHPIGQRRYGRWALAYTGWATAIDRVLSDALREHDGRELLQYMDQFVAGIC
jgi:hypothetical protein